MRSYTRSGEHNPEDRPLGCNGRYGRSGSTAHYKRGEAPCDACVASRRHYDRELFRGQPYPRRLKPHGTPAAASRHRRMGEELCFDCKVGEARYATELRARLSSQTST